MASASIEAFVKEARAFSHWATSHASTPPTVREALVRVTALYLAGVELGEPSEEFPSGDVPSIETYSKEITAIAQRLGSFRSRYYSEVFDPFESPKPEPVVGDLVDDFSDIFTDVSRGLFLYEHGHVQKAQAHWAYWLRVHWGEHATSAIRALHWDIAKGKDDDV
jgi:hypothetical protein